ncbi:MAG: amidohydrolase family protein, partial [Bilophila wadsworthia]
MKAIDFRFRPNTPDAVDGLIHSPFFGDMCAFFNYPDRAWSASLDKIVEIMDEHEITGVITGRDVETTYGCPCSNMGVVEMMRAYPHKFYGMAGLDPHKGMQAIDELSRMVNEFGMKGASVDPYLAKLPADHRKFYPIYAKCCE